MKLEKINNEVFYAKDEIISLNQKDLLELEELAQKSERKRARICTHKNAEDILQEMFIIHYNSTYVRPHSHQNKIESFHVVSGEADIFLFDQTGEIIKKIELGEYNTGKSFYYRIPPKLIHSLVIKSDVFIFHESTLGPFNLVDTFFPTWAPDGKDETETNKFITQLTTNNSI